jgi:UDP-N-acetylmuramoylalanine--D-glutamate ligase
MERMELKGKKVLVVGLGKSGLAAALFLRRRGAQVTVSDLRSAEVLGKEIPSLLEAGIVVEAGGHGLLTFRRQDLIVVSPGVPLSTPELVQVRNLGLPIIGELELAARFLKGKVLAITGSNGKTTTTTLCGEIFSAAGLNPLVAGKYWTARYRCGRSKYGKRLVRPGSVQLSIGDHGELSPSCRRDSQHHPRPPGPAWNL